MCCWYQLLSLYNCHPELLEALRHKTALQNCQSKVRVCGPLEVVRGLVEVPGGTYTSCDTRLNCRSPGGQWNADKGNNPHISCRFLPPPSSSGHKHKRTYFLLRRSRWTTREIQQSPFRTFKTSDDVRHLMQYRLSPHWNLKWYLYLFWITWNKLPMCVE